MHARVARAPLERPHEVVRTRFNEQAGRISPDGHRICYISDESGRNEEYVQSFPTPDRKHQVSTAGSTGGAWSKDGKKFLFGGPDVSAMEIDVETAPSFKAGMPRKLFRPRPDFVSITESPDFSRFS